MDVSKTNYRESIRRDIFPFIKNEGDRRRSRTVVVLTVDHVDWRLVVVSFPDSFSTLREIKVVRIDSFIALSWFYGWWCMAVLSWWSDLFGYFR